LDIFAGVGVLTSEVLFLPWEEKELRQCKSGLCGGCGRISWPQEVKRFIVAAAL